MLKKRVTECFELIYLHDPALDVFSEEEVVKWHNAGRDISMLDLKRCVSEPPTIFTCYPLKPDFQHILDADTVDELAHGKLAMGVAWNVFRTHVKAAKDYNDEQGKPLLEWTDGAKPIIKDECLGNIDKDVLIDIALTILRKAGDIKANFTLPDTFWGTRIRSRLLRASDADTKTASETTSK